MEMIGLRIKTLFEFPFRKMIERSETIPPEIVEIQGKKFVVGEEKIVYTTNGLFSICFVNRNKFVYKIYKEDTGYKRHDKKLYKLIIGTHLNEMPGEYGLNYILGEDGIPLIVGQNELTKEQREYFRENYREVPQRRAEDGLTKSQESELTKMKSMDLQQIEKALS